MQFLPDSEERMRLKDLHGGDGSVDDEGEFQEDDAWAETQALMQTIDDVELTDSTVEPERLLFRLFHEHGARVFDSTSVLDDCSCSEDKINEVLAGLSAQERQESVENGEISVSCQFCSKKYSFEPSDFASDT